MVHFNPLLGEKGSMLFPKVLFYWITYLSNGLKKNGVVQTDGELAYV